MSKKLAPVAGNHCRIYLVRHGQTEANKTGVLQGHLDSPLTEEGIRQAVARSQTFRDIDFADAFASDLFRAEKTAQIILADRELAVQTTQLLRERSFGSFDGVKIESFLTELRELLEYRESLGEEERYQYKLAPDIDSDQEIAERMLVFLRQTAVAYPGKNVLAVAHGGIMRAILIKLGYGTSSQLEPGCVTNLGFVVIDSDGVDFFIRQTKGVIKK